MKDTIFKKGDIVKCIYVENPSNNDVARLILNEIYIVAEDPDKSNVIICKDFGVFNYESNSLGGFYPKRFRKISKSDLTEKEKFRYIKYKLGIKGEQL